MMDLIKIVPASVWLVLSALFFAAGEYLSKKFALEPGVKWVLLIMLAYMIGTLAWLPAIFQKNQLSITGAIWSVLSIMATVGIGLLIFKEHLNTLQTIGLIFAVIALALLNYHN